MERLPRDDGQGPHWAEGILDAHARIVEVAAGGTLADVLRATLDEAERLTGSCIGFYHFLEADQTTLSLQAWSTRTARDYCKASGQGAHYPLDQAGVWADAVRARRPLIHNDYPSLPSRRGLPEGHAVVLRELVAPVLRGGLVVAILGVGNKPSGYGERDLERVRRLADLAWDAAELKRAQETARLEEAALAHSLKDLALSEEKFSKSFHSAPLLGALSRLSDGGLIDVNDLYCQTLGYTRAELIGRTSVELGLVHQEDRDRLSAVLQAQGSVKNQALTMYTRAGQAIPCLFSGEIVAVGERILLISMLADITELNRAEAERRQLQAQLQQAQKMESLGTLVAGVAHNMNNVLAVVMGTASLREQLTRDAGDLQAYRTIGRVCARGRDVVKSMIHFAQPTLAVQVPFELNAVVREVGAMVEGTARNRIRVSLDLAGEELWIKGDAGSINHVLMNLAVNAIDAMPAGGRLSFRSQAIGADQVEVRVEDDGAGIAPEVLAHVFEPFFTTKQVGEGAGLGLSMAYGVVKAHRGGIEIASSPGAGTTVQLRFPRTAPVRTGTSPAGAPLGDLNLYLVDDDEDVRFLMTRMLGKAGVGRVTAFAGGEQVLASLRSGPPPDLVILDQNMPGLSGVEVLARIRELHPDLAVLISSGQPDIEAWPEFRLPRVGVIQKPFSLQEIQDRLARFGG